MIRIDLRKRGSILILVLLLIGVFVALLTPYLGYTLSFNARYQDNVEKWRARRTTSYTAVVGSNSFDDPNAGRNTLRIEEGAVVAGENPDCPGCTLSDYQSLTVEALFERIEQECRWLFPYQFCYVAYHEELGYPIRLDTHPPMRNGRHRPSITLESLELQN